MDLQKITIQNFKCFQTEIEIELGKLTLLTGANSSGKSSIIYSILGAIQSGEFPFQFSTNGKYVNMGDFNDITFNHIKGSEIKLAYSFNNEGIYKIETVWIEDSHNSLPKLSALNVTADYFDLNIRYEKKKYVINLTYNPKKDSQNELLSVDFLHKHISSREFKDIRIEDKKELLNEIFMYVTKTKDINNLEIDEISFENKNFLDKEGGIRLRQILDIISKLFVKFDTNINFISSFRLHPDRGYLETSKMDLKVNNDGRGYLDQIMNWETKNPKKLKELINILKSLNLLYEIKSKRTEGGKYDLLIKTKKEGIFTSLYDVGFGISQFLPIVVSDLQLPKNSTLFVAQPEIHLHPSIQSSFGDYLVKQIKTQDKKYVIETHSEYLINKIRLAIVKGEIKEDEVKVIFVDNQANEAKIHKITFNKQGQILNAPENFFKTYMMDVMEIAINAAN